MAGSPSWGSRLALSAKTAVDSAQRTIRGRMKRMTNVLTLFGLILVLGLAPLQAQDLSQLAKKTREGRLKTMQQKSVRVWSNDNIPKAPAREGPTAAAGMSPVTLPATIAVTAEEPPMTPAGAESEAAALDSTRDKIKQDQQKIKGLEERLRLEEDELSMLQIQQANELTPSVQSELSQKILAKNAEIASQRQGIEKARKDLEAATKEFKAIGGSLEEQKK